ncbi:hypothetical protein DSM104443_00965 [Usitatibacter rugosus]|uniref:Uncharacterized protein n=1 Tax=Usitatibacter rugosus TaxID=2732067 RepID=A0A6M4GTS8_9PROT|nr:hypothetical protein [Usitatibacter rugosus]QJR09914.1 hypothetical protein DSM104443_00965 [Usitatibacter rugosus]
MNRLRLLAAALAATAAIPAFAVGNLADIRVYDRAAGRELPVYIHEGKAYVVGKPGNEYSLSVRNQSGDDLLAVMSVDGVNVLSGETAASRQGGYVISSWDSLDVKGWRKSLERTAAFYFTSLGDSYAARTGRPDNVGVIGVALYQRQRTQPPPIAYDKLEEAPRSKDSGANGYRERLDSAPAPEAQAKRAAPSLQPGAPLGTGHGRQEESQARYVDFRRATSYPVETVTIYYDSYRNLVARGILEQPVARRDPQPFPGFAPDPWR